MFLLRISDCSVKEADIYALLGHGFNIFVLGVDCYRPENNVSGFSEFEYFVAYLKLGRFDEAVVMLERAAALRPAREAIDDDLRQVRPMVTRRER